MCVCVCVCVCVAAAGFILVFSEVKWLFGVIWPGSGVEGTGRKTKCLWAEKHSWFNEPPHLASIKLSVKL